MSRRRIETRELRRFGFSFGTVLTILGSVALWRARAWGPWVLGVAGVVLLAAALAPRLLWPLEKVLATLLRALMTVITYLVLTLAYLLIFTPIGLFLRLTGKDLLERRFPGEEASYWVPIEADGPASRPDKPY